MLRTFKLAAATLFLALAGTGMLSSGASAAGIYSVQRTTATNYTMTVVSPLSSQCTVAYVEGGFYYVGLQWSGFSSATVPCDGGTRSLNVYVSQKYFFNVFRLTGPGVPVSPYGYVQSSGKGG